MSGRSASEERARREEHEALAQHYPALARLTPLDFDRFVDGAVARAGPQLASDAVGRVAQYSVVIGLAGLVFMVGLATLSTGAPPHVEPLPRSAAGLMAGIPAAGVVLGGRWVIGRLRARAERRTRVLAVRSVMLAGPKCAGCGYGLEGTPAMDGYENAVKCPECGLVNPMIGGEGPATHPSV